MKETHLRSVVKAATYRFFGTFVTVGIAWAVTGQWKVGVGVGLADTTVKIFIFYIHERVWHNIRFGRIVPEPDVMRGDGI